VGRLDELRVTQGWRPDAAPPTPTDLAELRRRFGRPVPADYEAFLALGAGFDGLFGESALQLYSPAAMLDVSTTNEVSTADEMSTTGEAPAADNVSTADKNYPDHLVIGSNRAGELYCIDPAGMYAMIPAISDPEDGDAKIRQGATLEALLERHYTGATFDPDGR
jgi:hypothetical protein